MNILFLDAYYEPEQIAFTHLENDLIEGLINDGHKIEIICPTPSRSVSEEVYKKYKAIKDEYKYDGNLHIRRFYSPREGNSVILRALRYLWCNIRTYQTGKNTKGIDLVICNSTPPTQGIVSGKIAKKLKVPFLYLLQDIFPDSLVTTGLAKKNSFLWRIGSFIEKHTYDLSTKIVVITDTMKLNLIEKNINEDKIEVISNWVDTEKVCPIAKEKNKIFDEYGIKKDIFTVLYAGNFGESQGAEIIIDAAKEMAEDSNYQFVIFGGGSKFLEAKRKSKNLPNVYINGLAPQEKAAEIYSMADIAIITGKKGVGGSGMPSKTWSIMACNTPIIASFDKGGELEKVLSKSKGGTCVNPENLQELINEIKKYHHSNTKCNSRNYVEQNASKKVCVGLYLSIINSIAKNI